MLDSTVASPESSISIRWVICAETAGINSRNARNSIFFFTVFTFISWLFLLINLSFELVIPEVQKFLIGPVRKMKGAELFSDCIGKEGCLLDVSERMFCVITL